MILGSTTNDVVYEVYIVLDSYGFIAFQPQTKDFYFSGPVEIVVLLVKNS